MTQAELERAAAESAFLQIEALDDPLRAPSVARRALVRADGAASIADQKARIALGAELLQTDTPWLQADDAGPAAPLRAFGEVPPERTREPGSRLMTAPACFAGAKRDGALVAAGGLEGVVAEPPAGAADAAPSDATDHLVVP